jgi:hypothetical protein
MNLTQISQKFRISEAYLNSKEDGLLIAASSIEDIIGELNSIPGTTSVSEKLERLKLFLKEVKNSSH